MWPERRLVVETDGYAAHRGSEAFEDDHERELVLHRLGYEVRRFTGRQVRESPGAVASIVRDKLSVWPRNPARSVNRSSS